MASFLLNSCPGPVSRVLAGPRGPDPGTGGGPGGPSRPSSPVPPPAPARPASADGPPGPLGGAHRSTGGASSLLKAGKPQFFGWPGSATFRRAGCGAGGGRGGAGGRRVSGFPAAWARRAGDSDGGGPRIPPRPGPPPAPPAEAEGAVFNRSLNPAQVGGRAGSAPGPAGSAGALPRSPAHRGPGRRGPRAPRPRPPRPPDAPSLGPEQTSSSGRRRERFSAAVGLEGAPRRAAAPDAAAPPRRAHAPAARRL